MRMRSDFVRVVQSLSAGIYVVINCYSSKIKILHKMPLYQMYFVKTRE